jgi:Cytochrome c7 and related cytochrome c
MAQIFRPGAILALKLALLATIGLLAAGVVAAYKSLEGPIAVGDAPGQPIPFSHKHHVGDDGIDCRYCHTSVEKSSFAGVPDTDVCLTCHSQLFRDAPVLQPLRDSAKSGKPLAWTRLHDLPDFVFFDHSIHVKKGVGCIECHGRIDEMPLTRRVASLEMQWCLGCHRDPGPRLRPPRDVFRMQPTRQASGRETRALVRELHLSSERRRTDCSTCHR